MEREAFQFLAASRGEACSLLLGERHTVSCIPSVHQVLAIIGRLPQPARMMAQLVALTGVRIGEAMGLRVEDCDLENRLIQIRRDIWHGREDAPKSENSAAPVLIGPVLAADLG